MSKKPTPKSFPFRPESQKHYLHHQPNCQDHKKKKKNKNKNLQAAVEEHGIVDIYSEDTPWLKKKMIRFKVEKTKSESRSTN
jgi:hypothetical protein